MKSKCPQTPLKKSVVLCGVAMLLASGSAMADFTPLSVDSPYVFGDWEGSRSQLKEQGVDFQVNYTMESASNISGGYHESSTARYTDQWGFGTTLDLDKLLNWKDTQFQATITSRNGQDLTQYVNDPRSGGPPRQTARCCSCPIFPVNARRTTILMPKEYFSG